MWVLFWSRIRESSCIFSPDREKIMELPPSSRGQGTVHRTVPFSWVRLPYVHCEIIQATRMGGLYYLEQDTGVEPAFTAWEAVVLPIYESCVSGIIAKRIGKFNLFLSDSLDKGCFCSPSPGLWVQKEAPQPGGRRCGLVFDYSSPQRMAHWTALCQPFSSFSRFSFSMFGRKVALMAQFLRISFRPFQ